MIENQGHGRSSYSEAARRRALFARLTLSTATALLVGSVAYLVYYLLNPTPQSAAAFWLLFAAPFLTLLARWVGLRYKLSWGVFLFTIFSSGTVGGIALFLPQMFALAATAYVILIQIAGMVLSPTAGFRWVMLGVVLYGILATAIRQAWVVPMELGENAVFWLQWVFYALIFLVVAYLSWLGSRELWNTLQESERRREELEQLSVQQQQTLDALEARSAELMRLLSLVQELAAPVVPIYSRVVLLPMIGRVDAGRARQAAQALLAGVQQHRARIAILDMTGAEMEDREAIEQFLQGIEALEAMGCEVALTGIRPEVARMFLHLRVRLADTVRTFRNLQAALAYAIEQHAVQEAAAS